MWQVIHEELKDKGLQIIGVAFDTAGKAAVEANILAEDIAERPEVLARLMGWAPELWDKQSPPTYPCLIDENHEVAALYGMVNVPQGVWIDESGQIVRPPESAGTTSMVRHMDRETFEVPDAAAEEGFAIRTAYVDALRDWVDKGDKSDFVLPAEEAKKRLRGPELADVVAAAHVRLAKHLYGQGNIERAKHHFDAAVELCPDKWNYRRQAMMLEPESVGELCAGPEFFAAVDALGDEPYYPHADLTPVR